MVAALTRHGDNRGVCKAACGALGNLAVNAANELSIAEVRGIGPVVAALTRHSDNSGVCESACGALRSLGVQYRQ